MAEITFSGLASGLDTGKLISQLVSIERSAADALVKRQSDLSSQKSIVGSMSSALATLGTAARALDLDTEVRPRGATTSDSRVAVAVSSGAVAGSYALRVRSLAKAQVTQSSAFAGNTAGIAGTGSVDITVGGTTKTVSWGATDTLDTIASKLNDSGAGITASVLAVDGSTYRLVVAAKDTGTSGAPSFVETGSGLGLADPANVKVAAANAVVSVNGIDITRSRNVISDALPGLTLTLGAAHAATDPDTTATVALDNKALADKVKAVVAGYTAVHSALKVQLDYTGTPKGPNTLFGDSMLRGLRSALDRVMASEYGSSNLAAIGITRDKGGAMSLDETKLAAAVAADPDAVSKIFVTGGFAAAVGTLADQYAGTGGLFSTKTQALTSRHTALQSQIDRIERSADATQARLEKQFGALEQAISAMRSQSSQLVAMLGLG